jgi:hypothetical protein
MGLAFGTAIMGRHNRYRDHIDPQYQRWGRKYLHFPGVAACARLIRSGKARGSQADIIVFELAENAANCLSDLIDTFRTDPSEDVRLYVMMALELARLPESAAFLTEVMDSGNPRFTPYAARALGAIDTPESRTALRNATHAKPENR